MLQKENCWFWLDKNLPESEQKINVLCQKCHDTNFPNLGWFWEGSRFGYGPFNFICGKCGHVIYQPETTEKP